jgi:ArsR family transcriptional regulator, arsenate/arsenite/antimonite-responsive transcriptional repressor
MNADRIFDALASPRRRDVLRRLAAVEGTTTELATALAMTAPAISRHLSILESAGLVTSRRDGQRVLYALVRDTVVDALSAFAAELSAAGGAAPGKPRREAI